jgi:ABC-type nitrate/sulfonate/bicarbonate transport system ATPase subunit
MSAVAAPAQPAAISLALQNITQDFPSPDGGAPNRVIHDISLSFNQAGINMLLGPSGCGKSTLLHMMGGVRPFGVTTPTSGTILIDGKRCDGPDEDVVMVFQQYANRPDMTVWENIYFPFTLKLWRNKVSRAEAKQRVEAMLHAVGLADKRNLYPYQVSGGQNQRVALARALVLRPRILLMDEPFGALDAQTREEMQGLLAELYRTTPCLVMFVTHDVTEALVLGDRVIVFATQPAIVSDDFTIAQPRPRDSTWLRSPEAMALQERVLSRLHQASAGKGSLRVSY